MKKLLVVLFLMMFVVSAYAVQDEPGTGLVSFIKYVPSKVTATQLTEDVYHTKYVVLSVLSADSVTEGIQIGSSSSVSYDNAFVMSSDTTKTLRLEIDDPSKIYVNTRVSGDGIAWIGVLW